MKNLLFTLFVILFADASWAQNQQQSECIIEKGRVKYVISDYNLTTGEKTIMVNGVRKKFNEVYPPKGAQYAALKKWYINNEKVLFMKMKFEKYGLVRVVGGSDLMPVGVYKGVTVFAEAGTSGVPEIIYLPYQSGCEFQPYQRSK